MNEVEEQGGQSQIKYGETKAKSDHRMWLKPVESGIIWIKMPPYFIRLFAVVLILLQPVRIAEKANQSSLKKVC
jgi:hypothetical protein